MIISIKKAILHILDANSGITVFSDAELDVSDASVNAFITKHIEKIYDDAALRSGEFTDSSGFKYHLNEYLGGNESFQQMSLFIAERVYDGISQAEKTESCDILVCHCLADERDTIAVLKLDNKIGFTHQISQENGKIANSLINHYAILPTTSQKISECAFVRTGDLTIRYKGKNRTIDGEKTDLIGELLLECVYDISPRESANAVNKIAKRVTVENGGDSIETKAKLKKFITENAVDEEYIETDAVAEAVFDGRPVMREEFREQMEQANVPKRVEKNKYVTKKMCSNIKLVTDTGVELTFPAEYYRDSKYLEIINNEDGTISIQINNIGEVINK